MARRVVITGMGCVTPLGHDVEATWQALLAGRSAIGLTTLFDAGTFPTQFSAQVRDFDLGSLISPLGDHAHACRNSQFALGAAVQAWQQSGVQVGKDIDPRRVGVYLGAGEGPLDFDNFVSVAVDAWDAENKQLDMVTWARLAYERMDRDRELEQEPNLPAAHVARLVGARGTNYSCLTACAASTQAVGEACEQIRRGEAEVILSGGTHSMIHPLGTTGFNRLTALSNRNDDYETASRPFDRTRDGFVLGEGAGIVVLESLESAQARGATILGEITGYGSSADAYRITDIHDEGRGGVAAMRRAIADAGRTIEDIDYVSAHGTGTVENDKIETLAIRQLFGDRAKSVPVSSIKSMIGHLIAAAGVVELISCVLAIRDGVIPATMNYREPDPECDLDYVPNEARKADVKVCLSNSFGFGGQNDTLIIEGPAS